jgi:hypothetical protein
MVNKSWLSGCWQFGIAGALALVGAIASSFEYTLARSHLMILWVLKGLLSRLTLITLILKAVSTD